MEVSLANKTMAKRAGSNPPAELLRPSSAAELQALLNQQARLGEAVQANFSP